MKTWQKLHQEPELWSRYLVKQEFFRTIRSFFETKGYRELESPILTAMLPTEQYMDFLSVRVGEEEYYLIPSTERFNKLALAAGIGNHFVISKVFRDSEKVGPNHSPEFTMLEWYHLDGTYHDLMQDVEQLIALTLQRLGKADLTTEYQGQLIDFSPGWPKATIAELFKQYADLDLFALQDIERMRQVVSELKLMFSPDLIASSSWQDLFELIFFNKIEVNLPQNRPIFIYDYPKLLCPLAQPNEDGFTSQKLELYIAGKEVANGYSELRDAKLLEDNMREQYAQRQAAGKATAEFDTELVEALHHGLPRVAGIGMGVDRVAMILADAESIADINLFPLGE